MDLVFRSRHFRPPPPETMFLHRKLVGCFLLCARMGARFAVQDLVLPFLGGDRQAAGNPDRKDCQIAATPAD